MSQKKRQIREALRKMVLGRDGHRCRVCGAQNVLLDVHHITNRTEMPNGGYAHKNGITLCNVPGGCHEKAETFHKTGTAEPGYSPDELYALIGSSREKAERVSQKL